MDGWPVAVRKALPWQDVPLFVIAHEAMAPNGWHPAIQCMRPMVRWPLRVTTDPSAPLDVGVETVMLLRQEFRWGASFALVYCQRDDRRVLGALALLGLASQLINAIADALERHAHRKETR